MRGRSCPKAWVFPVPERVCSKVLSTSSKSLASRAGTRKSWHVSKNLLGFSQESLSHCQICCNIYTTDNISASHRCYVFQRERGHSRHGPGDWPGFSAGTTVSAG